MPHLFFISDLHLEHRTEESWELFGDPDIVVLAGDVHTKARGVKWAQDTFSGIPVVYILGNHEGWGKHWQDVLSKMRDQALGSNVHILHRNSVQLCGIRFLGATLWTDFSAWPDKQQAYDSAVMVNRDRYAPGMRDYRKIRTGGYRRLHPRDVLGWNTEDKNFLLSSSSEPFDGPTVVVSHHPPSLAAMKFPAQDPSDAGYASDWEYGVKQISPVAWLYGHTHSPKYFHVGNTLMASHAVGHPEEGLSQLFKNALNVPLDGSPVKIIKNKYDLRGVSRSPKDIRKEFMSTKWP